MRIRMIWSLSKFYSQVGHIIVFLIFLFALVFPALRKMGDDFCLRRTREVCVCLCVCVCVCVCAREHYRTVRFPAWPPSC
ncbi:MAG TPA: hypothetical protein V6C97_07360 [Oculatellaceae cyanobacterium]